VRARRPWTRIVWIATAAAAVIAFAVVSTSRLRPIGEPSIGEPSIDDPTTFASLLPGSGLDSAVGHPWATRGSGADSQLQSQATAVRIGATITDLVLASRAGGPPARGAVSTTIRMLNEVDGAGGAVAQFRQIDSVLIAGSVPGVELLSGAARSAALAAGPSATNAGAWLEAARVAALRRDSVFLANPASRDALSALDHELVLTPTARGAVARVRSLERSVPRDWSALAAALGELLAALAIPL
jgi:hypothetical protein